MDVENRYKEKVMLFCNKLDPFELKLTENCDALPTNFGYFDLVNYCLHKDSPFTRNDFNNWKAMDAYKYYESGWVQTIGCKKIDSGTIIFADVRVQK